MLNNTTRTKITTLLFTIYLIFTPPQSAKATRRSQHSKDNSTAHNTATPRSAPSTTAQYLEAPYLISPQRATHSVRKSKHLIYATHHFSELHYTPKHSRALNNAVHRLRQEEVPAGQTLPDRHNIIWFTRTV